MPFEKGHSLAKGRPKGSENKEMKRIREWIGGFLDNNTQALEDEILALEGKEKVQAILSLLEYAVPKLARTEITSEDGSGFILKVITHTNAGNS